MKRFVRRPLTSRSRGQATIEFALVLMIVLPLTLGVLLFWRAFYDSWAYSQAASGMVSWISAGGEFTTADPLTGDIVCPASSDTNASMRCVMQEQLTSMGVSVSPSTTDSHGLYGNSGLYAAILITLPDGTSVDLGAPPPSGAGFLSGSRHDLVPTGAWGAAAQMCPDGTCTAPFGSKIEVWFYSDDQVNIPMTPVNGWMLSSGHAIGMSRRDSGS